MIPGQEPQLPARNDLAPPAPGPSPQDLLQAMQAAGFLVIVLVANEPRGRSIKR